MPKWRTVGILTAFLLIASAGAATASAPSTRSGDASSSAIPTDEQSIITLKHGEELILPPSQRRKFQYDATVNFWSVVAVTDAPYNDLALYADKQNTELLAKSTEGKGSEFIVVDSNHAPLPVTYYPTVTGDGSGPNYTIEIDSDGTQLGSQPLDVPMSNRDLVTIQDTALQAGATYRFTVSAEPDQNPSLYLMQSDRHDYRTWFQARHDNVAEANRLGPGEPESFTYKAPEGGWYAVVLVNVKGMGSGVYHITRTRVQE
jgi:hypothetical protein